MRATEATLTPALRWEMSTATSGNARNSSQMVPISQPNRSQGEGVAVGAAASSVMVVLLIVREAGLLAGTATAHQQERGDGEDDRPAHQVHQRDPQAVALH